MCLGGWEDVAALSRNRELRKRGRLVVGQGEKEFRFGLVGNYSGLQDIQFYMS